jgi:hypothetical protein
METFVQIPGLPVVLRVEGVDVSAVMNAVQRLRHEQGPGRERIFHGFSAAALVDFSQLAMCAVTDECPAGAKVVKIKPSSLGM